MIHLLETNLPDKKTIFVALKKVYGINKYTSLFICKKLGFSLNFKTKNLTNNQKLSIIRVIEKLQVLINSDLKKKKSLEKKKLIEIKLYRGLRKLKGYPVRGQRTRSNARTAKKIKNIF
jgi:small subunit ribosomal protein S13